MTSRGTFNDAGCSSSEEDAHRADTKESIAEQRTRDPAPCRRHPFSVEALMSGWKTEDRRRESADCKRSSVAVSPLGVNSLHLCRDTHGGSRSSSASPSPVKSEALEAEECAAWVARSAFSAQPRTFLPPHRASKRPYTWLENLHEKQLLGNPKRCGRAHMGPFRVKRQELSLNPVQSVYIRFFSYSFVQNCKHPL
ncbi:unnamed protein product [Tetraodon nigroviridis]|uniref:(spotted green pufferfish) hypothetical protein n=1 Tax=Tetraodon nigroviridis TaxID=99883 RepID=Q4RIQ6_TETNG|nr:unnamed protein product [Tetraodon nigroviridis]